MAVPTQIDVVAAGGSTGWPQEIAWNSALRHVPAAATAAVVTIEADASRPNVISQIFWSYSAAPTAGSLKVEDVSGTIVWGPHHITAGGPGQVDFMPPLCNAVKNTAMIVTLASGGGAVEGVLSVNAYKRK